MLAKKEGVQAPSPDETSAFLQWFDADKDGNLQ